MSPNKGLLVSVDQYQMKQNSKKNIKRGRSWIHVAKRDNLQEIGNFTIRAGNLNTFFSETDRSKRQK